MADYLNQQLATLLSAVQQSPKNSIERYKALHRLLLKLQTLPGLIKVNHLDYPEALNRTWEWVCRDIDKFDVSKSAIANASLQTALTNWINGYLRFRLKDLSRNLDRDPYAKKYQRGYEYDIDFSGAAIPDLVETRVPDQSLSGLEEAIAQEHHAEQESLYHQLRQWVEADPEQSLRNCHPKSCSGCNCHFLSQRLLLIDSPDSFTQLAKELNINYQSLMTHWKRKCHPLLQQKLIALGYQSELE